MQLLLRSLYEKYVMFDGYFLVLYIFSSGMSHVKWNNRWWRLLQQLLNTACVQNTQMFEVSANGTVHTITNAPQGDSIRSVSCLKRISTSTARQLTSHKMVILKCRYQYCIKIVFFLTLKTARQSYHRAYHEGVCTGGGLTPLTNLDIRRYASRSNKFTRLTMEPFRF